MWPDRESNPGPLTYESGALPTALRGPASFNKVGWMGAGACPCWDPQSMSLDLSYHKEYEYIWLRHRDLNSF